MGTLEKTKLASFSGCSGCQYSGGVSQGLFILPSIPRFRHSAPPPSIPRFHHSRFPGCPSSFTPAFRHSRLPSFPPSVIPAFRHSRLPSFPRKRESIQPCRRRFVISQGVVDSRSPVGVGDKLRGNDRNHASHPESEKALGVNTMKPGRSA